MKESYEVRESYEPSPLDIWLQCSDIRATWSPDEERKRRGAAKDRWCLPGYERKLRFATSSRIGNR
jgi:hypothetical protein